MLVLEQAFAAILPELEQNLASVAVAGFDFAPQGGGTFASMITRGAGHGRNPHTDLSCPLLIVYTVRYDRQAQRRGAPAGGVVLERCHEPAHAQHDVERSCADGPALLPRRRAQHPDHACAASRRDGHDPFLLHTDTALATIAQERPTLSVMVPAIIQAVTEHPGWPTADLSSLKAIATGSTMVPPHLIERFVARGVPVRCRFTARRKPARSRSMPRLGGDLSRAGSTGLPGLCCEAKVIGDDGHELPAGTPGAKSRCVAPNVFFEYWGNADATREALHDGWYRTGDIGLCDDDGYFWVRDRKKNLIISGGENIYPAEVERVLLEHPDVSECAVIGRPDPRWDEVPIAYVIRRAGCRLEADQLKLHMQAQLARYKIPRDIVFVTDLPRTALGKVQHFLLKQLDAQSHTRGDVA